MARWALHRSMTSAVLLAKDDGQVAIGHAASSDQLGGPLIGEAGRLRRIGQPASWEEPDSSWAILWTRRS